MRYGWLVLNSALLDRTVPYSAGLLRFTALFLLCLASSRILWAPGGGIGGFMT